MKNDKYLNNPKAERITEEELEEKIKVIEKVLGEKK